MSKAEKLDLYKKHKAEYVSPKNPVLVETKPARYLAVTGRGEPGSESFRAKIGALYAVAYTLKFASKAAGRDYVVCKLEGQYWGPRGKRDFTDSPREEWNWKLLIRVPEFTTPEDLAAARKSLIEKGKEEPVREVKLETLEEGRCVQMLHVGPYSEEGKSIGRMEGFARENRLAFRGRHHEIYLSDPRRVAPEKLRTILRMPVRA